MESAVLRPSGGAPDRDSAAPQWRSARWVLLLLACCALVSLALLAQSLFYSRYGFDVTDEAFYLFWIADPRAYAIHIPASLFGFAYHPLFVLLHGDLATLRQANVLLSFTLSFLLAWTILRRFWLPSTGRGMGAALPALGFACLALVSFNAWLLTPSYNSLAFQSLAMAATGLLLCDGDDDRQGWAGVTLIAVGGWLAFLAKPSTAAALAVAVFLYACVAGRRCIRRVVLAGLASAALLLVSAIAIDGSIGRFVTRLADSVQMLRLLGSGQEFSKIFRIDEFTLAGRDYAMVAAIVLGVIAADRVLLPAARGRAVVGGLAFAFGFLALLVGLGLVPRHPGLKGATFFIVAVSLVLGFVLARPGEMLRSFSRRQLAFGFFLLLAPHIYSFGTNGNYWENDRDASLFWILAALVLASPYAAKERALLLLVAVAFGVQLFTAALVDQTLTQPYRQPHSLRQNTERVDLPGGGGVVMASGFHDYFSEAQRTAKQAGFARGMPMIDLTGQSPGILYLLGARSLGQPWLVGAYPGSNQVAVANLALEKCSDVASAWLLEEPGGPRSLSVAAVLRSVGADRERDYELVGSFMTAEYAGGYPQRRRQNLLKPVRAAAPAIEACESARKRMTEGGSR